MEQAQRRIWQGAAGALGDRNQRGGTFATRGRAGGECGIVTGELALAVDLPIRQPDGRVKEVRDLHQPLNQRNP